MGAGGLERREDVVHPLRLGVQVVVGGVRGRPRRRRRAGRRTSRARRPPRARRWTTAAPSRSRPRPASRRRAARRGVRREAAGRRPGPRRPRRPAARAGPATAAPPRRHPRRARATARRPPPQPGSSASIDASTAARTSGSSSRARASTSTAPSRVSKDPPRLGSATRSPSAPSSSAWSGRRTHDHPARPADQPAVGEQHRQATERVEVRGSHRLQRVVQPLPPAGRPVQRREVVDEVGQARAGARRAGPARVAPPRPPAADRVRRPRAHPPPRPAARRRRARRPGSHRRAAPPRSTAGRPPPREAARPVRPLPAVPVPARGRRPVRSDGARATSRTWSTYVCAARSTSRSVTGRRVPRGGARAPAGTTRPAGAGRSTGSSVGVGRVQHRGGPGRARERPAHRPRAHASLLDRAVGEQRRVHRTGGDDLVARPGRRGAACRTARTRPVVDDDLVQPGQHQQERGVDVGERVADARHGRVVAQRQHDSAVRASRRRRRRPATAAAAPARVPRARSTSSASSTDLRDLGRRTAAAPPHPAGGRADRGVVRHVEHRGEADSVPPDRVGRVVVALGRRPQRRQRQHARGCPAGRRCSRRPGPTRRGHPGRAQGQLQPTRQPGAHGSVGGVLRQLDDEPVAVGAERVVLLGVGVLAQPRRRRAPAVEHRTAHRGGPERVVAVHRAGLSRARARRRARCRRCSSS